MNPEDFWDLHGTSLFALACALLGDQAGALRAVSLAMVDVYSPPDGEAERLPDVTLRRAAGCVYSRCSSGFGGPTIPRTLTIPPLMFWLGELARDQRSALALCAFGGHNYQQAASQLDIPSEVAADLVTSGLHDLCRLTASGNTSPA